MSRAKQTSKTATAEVRSFRGKGDLSLPVFYRGKIVRIKSDAATEFVIEELPYESKIHIEQALVEGSIEEVTGE